MIENMYGASVSKTFRLGILVFGFGGPGNMIKYAINNNPMVRNADARTPQANPVLPWISWFSMIGYTTPPNEVPVCKTR